MYTARLRAAIDHYDDLLVREHLASTQECLERAIQERGLFLGGRPTCNVLRPYFVTSKTYDEWSQAATLVCRGLTSLAQRLASDAVLRRALILSPVEETLIQLDPGEPTEIVGRIDGFIDPDGRIRFIEYNPAPGGLSGVDELAEVFAGMPIMQSFAQQYQVRSIPTWRPICNALLQTHHRKGGKGRPSIAVLSQKNLPPAASGTSLLLLVEMNKMLQCVQAEGFEVRMIDPAELTLVAGHLHADDYRIDAALVADWPNFLAGVGPDAPFWQAVRSGAIWIINSAATAILRGSKSLFALLSDPLYGHLFEPEVAVALTRHIPWTRRVVAGETTHRDRTIELVPFIAAHREELVLKPADEYGGKGVVLGWECDDAAWDAALERALGEPYVVQERVPIGRDAYPSMIDGELCFEERYFDVDPFVWNDTQASGCMVRLSKTTLLNQTAGGGTNTPMFVIEL